MDRIKGIKKSKEAFITTKGFNSKTYFNHSFGITRKLNEEPLELVLKFNKFNAHYILSKPLHHSQKVIEQTDDYVIVSIKVYESHELNMAILSHGSGVEVIEPKSYIDYIKGEAAQMLKTYK
jgi:predicted DNA-binding transcriptional regulator YafY